MRGKTLGQKLNNISKPFVILCEGMHDSQFFTHLIRVRQIPDRFEIVSVNYALGLTSSTGGGNTKFTDALDAIVAVSGFNNVLKVLVVADCDDNPAQEFQRTCSEINAAAAIIGPPRSQFVAPGAPSTVAGANPEVAVLMMPPNFVAGSLSTMCWAAAKNANPVPAACVDAFAACTGAVNWTPNKLAKMKLHALIAGTYQAKPNLGPAYVWSLRPDPRLVPLTDPVFDDVEAFLRAF